LNHWQAWIDLFPELIDGLEHFAQIDLNRPSLQDMTAGPYAYRRVTVAGQRVTISERCDYMNREVVFSRLMNPAAQSGSPSTLIEIQISESTTIKIELSRGIRNLFLE
jgi:hypothetical protein